MDRPELSAVEWLARTADVGVRVNTLGGGQATPWHFHGEVTDYVFCLEEELVVELRAPDARVQLRPGQRNDVAPRRVHRVVNPGPRAIRYLLVQATGRYDFNVVAEPAPARG